VIVMGDMNIDRARELDAADPLREYRDRFVFEDPALIYLNGNSLGPLPKATKRRLDQVIATEWGAALGRSWDHWVDLPERAGEAVATLIGAAPGQTIVTDNTTMNLYKLASAALDARPGRHVIVTDNDNFPTDRYVLEGIADQHNLEFRMISTDLDEGIDTDLLRRAVDDDTALVSLSHVAYRSGAFVDMRALTEIAHQSGSLMLWDLCHAVGAVPIQLDECDADLAVGCTYKYLSGGPGSPAFCYVARRHQAALDQPLTGWHGHSQPFAMEPGYRGADGIGRARIGTPPMLSLLALDAALDVFDDVDLDLVRAKSLRLGEFFMAGADEAGFEVITPRAPERRGSHVTLRHPDALPVMAALIEAGVIGDVRPPDLLRFGFNALYNSFGELGRALEILGEVLSSGRYREPRFQVRPAVT